MLKFKIENVIELIYFHIKVIGAHIAHHRSRQWRVMTVLAFLDMRPRGAPIRYDTGL